MMVFPFCIILGTVTDYSQAVKSVGLSESSTMVKFRIFKPAEVWTLAALKYFGNKIVRKAEKKYRESESQEKDKKKSASNSAKENNEQEPRKSSNSKKNE